MKKYKIMFLVFLLAVMSACSQSPSAKELEYVEERECLNIDVILNSDNEYSPCDFINLNNDILVATDNKNDCLLIIDKDSGSIKKSGQTGNGSEDYLSPHGIWIINDLIYVMDSGNMRIKVLDKKLNYKNEINLDSITFIYSLSMLNDISVDIDGNIFFTIDSTEKEDAKLFCIKSGTNEPKIIMKNCTGVVTSYNNTTYFANTYEFGENKDGEYAASGTHYIYEIENNEIKTSYILPEEYTPAGLYADKCGLYCSSLSYREISKINLNTTDVNPFFSETTTHNESLEELKDYGSLLYDNTSWWLIETNHNVIYRLKEE